MDDRLQNRVQRYGWDRAAGAYEGGWSEQLQPGQRLMLAMADPQPGDRALEVAAGTGLVTVQLCDAVGAEGFVLATDISEAMLAKAADAASGHTNVAFARAAAEELDVDDASFDVAVCAFGLMYVSNPAAALVRMRRALRATGRVAIAVWGSRANCGWASVFPITEAKVKSDVCPLFFRLGTGATLAHEMGSAGFQHVEMSRLATVLRYASESAAVAAAFVGGPVALAYSRFDSDTKAAVARDYLSSIAPYRAGDGYEIPGEFVVASGRSPHFDKA